VHSKTASNQSSNALTKTSAVSSHQMPENQFTLELPRVLATQILSLARDAAPFEIVGVLGGPHAGRVSTMYPLQNVADQPERAYQAEPAGLARALVAIRREQLELVGIYHSHPNGPSTPSSTDLKQATWDVPYLIVDAHSGVIQAWLLFETLQTVHLEII
jgi:proteasome lid subunit RPN8/RPN11